MKPAEIVMGWEQQGSRVVLIKKARGALEVRGRQAGKEEQRFGEWGGLHLIEALNCYHNVVDAMKVTNGRG